MVQVLNEYIIQHLYRRAVWSRMFIPCLPLAHSCRIVVLLRFYSLDFAVKPLPAVL